MRPVILPTYIHSRYRTCSNMPRSPRSQDLPGHLRGYLPDIDIVHQTPAITRVSGKLLPKNRE